MFKKSFRFSFRGGVPKKSIVTPFFIVRYDTSEENNTQIAVVVGKKVSKKAVERNKIKRQLVAQLKENLTDLNGKTLVLYARKPIIDASKEEIAVEIEKIKTRL